MVGMLLLLVAGVVTTDVVTSSSLRSFLSGASTSRSTSSQNQAYSYIRRCTSETCPRRGHHAPITNPRRGWLSRAADGHQSTSSRDRRVPQTPDTVPTAVPSTVGSAASAAANETCADPAQCRRPGIPAQPRRVRRGDRRQRPDRDPGPLRLDRQPRPRARAAAGASRPAHPDPARVRHQTRAVCARAPRPSTCPPKSTGSHVPGAGRGRARAARSSPPSPSIPPTETLASLTHVELIVSIVVVTRLAAAGAVDRALRACAPSTT